MANDTNSEQIEFWNGDAGAMWTKRQERMDALLAPISDAVLEACTVKRGDRVLDIGCGCGETSLRLAQRGAVVVGVDISKPMLGRAKERAEMERASATFVLGDAAVTPFERVYDQAFSRFGVMFFGDPTAAFANIRTGVRSGGKLCFVCWQPPQLNAWISAPFAAARPMLPPQPTLDPRAPGPFAFAEPDYVRTILAGAGFRDIRIDGLTTSLVLGRDVDTALEMVCEVGPLSRSLAGIDPAVRERIIAAVRAPLQAALTAGGVALGASCWIVHATA
jgi:SAM-dependent methyltransferase